MNPAVSISTLITSELGKEDGKSLGRIYVLVPSYNVFQSSQTYTMAGVPILAIQLYDTEMKAEASSKLMVSVVLFASTLGLMM